MLEKAIVARVIATAKAMGWWACKMHGNAYSQSGLPDVLAIKDGRAAWMECKRPGFEPTRIQRHVMSQLEAAGCRVAVITSAGEARAFLEGFR